MPVYRFRTRPNANPSIYDRTRSESPLRESAEWIQAEPAVPLDRSTVFSDRKALALFEVGTTSLRGYRGSDGALHCISLLNSVTRTYGKISILLLSLSPPLSAFDTVPSPVRFPLWVRVLHIHLLGVLLPFYLFSNGVESICEAILGMYRIIRLIFTITRFFELLWAENSAKCPAVRLLSCFKIFTLQCSCSNFCRTSCIRVDSLRPVRKFVKLCLVFLVVHVVLVRLWFCGISGYPRMYRMWLSEVLWNQWNSCSVRL